MSSSRDGGQPQRNGNSDAQRQRNDQGQRVPVIPEPSSGTRSAIQGANQRYNETWQRQPQQGMSRDQVRKQWADKVTDNVNNSSERRN
ncbi:hypothetical protein ACLMJK_004108 [Lecanora helva]